MSANLNLNKYKNLLSNTKLFCDMDDNKIKNALNLLSAEILSYNKDEYLHAPYTPMKKFGLILSGTVHVCMDDIEGNKIIMAQVTPGITFGESICFLNIEDSPVYVYAFEYTDVLWLSADRFFKDFKEEFSINLKKRFITMLAQRTLLLNNRIQILSKLTIREKITTYLSIMARQTNSTKIQITMSREDFATYIGSNRCALSRELSNMKREGLIDYGKNYIQIIKQKD